ncbi:MAG: hypothetical protein ACRECQ_12265 [Burkholderiaceae bacterium]
MTDSRSFSLTAVRMFSGVLIWSAHFLFIYAFTALACTRGFADVIPAAVVIATGIGVVAASMMLRAGLRRDPKFSDWMTTWVCGLAIVAMLWETLPLLWIPVCGAR